ncbi:MAG: hypothetical protein ACYTBX_08160 [Planctomycetota bacterium]|jgi:DNA-binding MltR family transcriptional regulator
MKAKYSIPPAVAELLNYRLKDGPVEIDRDAYDMMKKKMLEDEQYVLMLLWDNSIENLLENILKKTFSQQGREALSLVKSCNIMQKARLVYALELINETTLKDIKLIHDIRNKFAHVVRKGFANAGVCALCGKLSTANGKKATANNSYDIYYKSVLKHIKRLAMIISKSHTHKIPLMSGTVLKIKPKRKNGVKSQQSNP